MIDVKKLVTGFLILATIAVCSGLVLSLVTNNFSGTANAAPAGPSIAAGSSAAPAVQTNAFVDTGSLQGNAAEILSDTETTSTNAQATDPDNLTNIFADSFLNGLNAANPDGLPADSSGTAAIATPDTAAIAASISSNPIVENFTPPNWDTEAQSDSIVMATSSSPSGITDYSTALNNVFNSYFVATNLQSEVSNAVANPSVLPYVSSEIQSALDQALTIPTPAKLVALQKSVVKVMVYEKNTVQLAENANADPVKAALTLQAEQPKYTAALTALQQQMQQAATLGVSLNETPEKPAPFIAQLFGIQTAHAQFIVEDPTTFGELVLDTINSTLLQIMKNTLIALIQKKVLTAIQGANGVPKFVTDFGAQLVNSFQVAALSTLNSELAEVPQYQAPTLNALLSTVYQAPNSAVRTNGLTSPDTNLQNLNNGFTNYTDYLALFGTGGNIWSNAMTIHDDSLSSGANSQSANQTQNIAQQGWNADGGCAGGANPNGQTLVCPAGAKPSDNPNLCVDANNNYVPPLQIIPSSGICTSGQNITAPGQVTGQSMSAVLQSGTQLITSANDITGLLDALTVSLINQLSQEAINAASGAVNGALGGGSAGVGGIPPGGVVATPPASAQTAVQCIPSTQQATLSLTTGAAIASVSAGGGKIDNTCAANNDCPTTENPDGTPHYNWSAPGSTQGAGGQNVLTGQSLLLTYTTAGTYFVTVTASTDGTQATCQLQVQ